jgi:nucleotide-binding universal stress UspA family protein
MTKPDHAMIPVRAILHPTDFSERSRQALAVARALARDHGARLIVLHVAPIDIAYGGTIAAPVDPRYYQDALDEEMAALRTSDLPSPVEPLLLRGEPAAEIVRAAQEHGCDLIVIGTHGRTGLPRLLLGSVAEGVMRRAQCPVLTVKSPVAAAAPAAEPATPTTA